jgi:hypothetical protein
LKYSTTNYQTPVKKSPLTQGRGLKFSSFSASLSMFTVAPHAGAWIEIFFFFSIAFDVYGRPSRRGVD